MQAAIFLPPSDHGQTVLVSTAVIARKRASSIPQEPSTSRAKRRVIATRRPVSVMPLAKSQGKRHASHAPASLQWKVSRSVPSPGHAPGDDGMNFSQDVVPWRVPGLVTERTRIAENRHQRQPPQGSNPNRMASPPRHQNAFPLHPLKSVLVSRPLAGLFSILHARALLPPRSVPNCKQTGIGNGGQSRRRVEHPVAYLREQGRFARIGSNLIRN